MKRLVNEKEIIEVIEQEFERTGGIFRLAPCWVGRPGIIVPGRRIKLLDDYMSQDVAVNERWLASTTYADNGVYNEVCPPDHGLSYMIIGDLKIQLKDAIGYCGELLLGNDKQWDVLPKFFDNWGRIPNHIHPCDDHVKDGLKGKPESYYFPLELNINKNDYPRSAFGVDPSYSDDMVLKYLSNYFKGDNRMTDISNFINLVPGTGWFMPPCTLHAPGSLVTYELQVASDVTCIPESRVDDMVMPPDLIDRDTPVTIEKDGEEKMYEYILSMTNCPNSGNKDNFRQEYFRQPVRIQEENGCFQDYVIYRCGKASESENPDLYSSKHTIITAKKDWQITESAAFGAIVLSGYGQFVVDGKEPVEIESASLYYDRDEIGADEVFVSASAASKLKITNSSTQRLSFYQHFASNSNPESGTIKVPGL